jgi:hypothetical protein
VSNCPDCGRDNDENAKICMYCGSPMSLAAAATRNLEDADYEEGRPHWGTARFNQRMRLIINERDTKDRKEFYFDEDSHEIMLGRIDPETGEAPDYDLTPFGASQKGVSRRHAMVVRRDNNLNIVDLGTPNGTYLNGQRLVANQPRVLRDGDEVRLGYLVLRITFDRV